VVPPGPELQSADQQFLAPVVVPLMICTDLPLTVNVCSQTSVHSCPSTQLIEQFATMSPGELMMPLGSVVQLEATGFCPQPSEGLHGLDELKEIAYATLIPACLMGTGGLEVSHT